VGAASNGELVNELLDLRAELAVTLLEGQAAHLTVAPRGGLELAAVGQVRLQDAEPGCGAVEQVLDRLDLLAVVLAAAARPELGDDGADQQVFQVALGAAA
jgi:hypothetical protein